MLQTPLFDNEAPPTKGPDARTSDRASWGARSMRQSTFSTYQPTGWEPDTEAYKNPDWLHQQYWENELSIREIADLADVSARTIEVWLTKHGIETRRDGRPTDGDTEPLKDKVWLRRRYWYDGMSAREIADHIGVTNYAVLCWMREHGIERRPQGEFSYNESDRIDYGPGWTESKREAVRERDGCRCVDCGMHAEEHEEKYGRTLHVHHKVKARLSTNPAVYNAMRNLVTLCAPCHNEREDG